jgi:hypothetical protein
VVLFQTIVFNIQLFLGNTSIFLVSLSNIEFVGNVSERASILLVEFSILTAYFFDLGYFGWQIWILWNLSRKLWIFAFFSSHYLFSISVLILAIFVRNLGLLDVVRGKRALLVNKTIWSSNHSSKRSWAVTSKTFWVLYNVIWNRFDVLFVHFWNEWF